MSESTVVQQDFQFVNFDHFDHVNAHIHEYRFLELSSKDRFAKYLVAETWFQRLYWGNADFKY